MYPISLAACQSAAPLKNQGASAADDETVAALDDRSGDENSELDEIFKHLPIDQHMLLKEIKMDISKIGKDTETGYMIGAVLEGLPENPAKATTCAYIVRHLPDPDLGDIPRDEIYQELKDNPVKLARQRRDVGLLDGDTASQLKAH